MQQRGSNFAGIFLVLALALASSGTQAWAVVVHDEALNGDLSGIYTNPKQLSLAPGINSLLATTVEGDVEYVRIDLPVNHWLSGLELSSYVSEDLTSFIALQSGEAFTFPVNQAPQNIGNMLGFGHFGPDTTDLLSLLGGGPLAGPTYTFWIQQTGNETSYQIDFIATRVPEPATWLLVGMTFLGGALTRRGWRRAR
jgi:hypothetical protein